MVSLDPQRGEPDLLNSIQMNFISEGYLKIPLDLLSKDEAVQIINILLNKVSSKEQRQENTREDSIRKDSAFQPQMDEVGSQDFKVRRSKLHPCSYCQKRHIFGSLNCEAYGRNCQHCGRRNHIRDACWVLYPHLRRFKFFRKQRSVLRCNNSLRKSFSAPNSLNFGENADQVSRGSGTSLPLIQKHSLTTATRVCNRQKDPEKHLKIADLTEDADEQEILDSGQDAQIATDVSEHDGKDPYNHALMSVFTTNGKFGYDISSKKQEKARYIEDRQEQSWDEKTWALKQIDLNTEIDWFESEYTKEYYVQQGGEILRRFIEKFKKLKEAKVVQQLQ